MLEPWPGSRLFCSWFDVSALMRVKIWQLCRVSVSSCVIMAFDLLGAIEIFKVPHSLSVSLNTQCQQDLSVSSIFSAMASNGVSLFIV